MKKMKKTISLVMAGVMTASLAGCGGGNTETQTTAASAETKAEVQSEASQPAESTEGKTTITFINGFTGGDGPFMTKIVDSFNQSQDKYYIEQLQDADHYTKFKSDDFDMLIIHADWISTYHADGLLREVSDIYEMAGISFENDFHPITQTYAKYDDGIFAFPLDLYAETFYYNKEYVKEQPKTYEDMIALRDELDSENSGIYPMAIPLTGRSSVGMDDSSWTVWMQLGRRWTYQNGYRRNL